MAAQFDGVNFMVQQAGSMGTPMTIDKVRSNQKNLIKRLSSSKYFGPRRFRRFNTRAGTARAGRLP